MDYFYDAQCRRYLLQFMRIFSDIKIRTGPDAAGNFAISRIPIMYGDPSNMIAQIIHGVSENTLMPSPMFSVWIESIKMAPERRQDSQYVGKVSKIERQFNEQTQQYNQNAGIRYDIDRYMPVPYDLYLKLDCWTTNTTTKMQIMEQIAVIFNPSIQLQQNSNTLDWTSIFEVWMEDITWTNRSIPQGAEIDRDVISWKFKVPIWINPPAKVKRSTLIAEIVTNVFNTNTGSEFESSLDGNYDYFRESFGSLPDAQIITTVGNYRISITRNNGHDEITLLNPHGAVMPIQSWKELIYKYGQISPNITKIRLKLDPDIDVSTSDIIGNIIEDPVRKNILIFTPDVDTLPATTILPIADIIDPAEVTPGNGLPLPVAGQRYLLVSANSDTEEPAIPLGVSTSPWGDSIVAYPNDIIEFSGVKWIVIFDSQHASGLNYVVNNTNSTQYTFDALSQQWAYTYYGEYSPGYWRIDNLVPYAPSGV